MAGEMMIDANEHGGPGLEGLPMLSETPDKVRAEAAGLFRDAGGLFGRWVEKSWLAGERLARAKELTPHGEWLPWLKSEGIPDRSARYLMEFSKTASFADLPMYDSVSAALKALKPAQPREPKALPSGPPRRDLELDAANMEIEEKAAKIEEQAARIRAYEAEGSPLSHEREAEFNAMRAQLSTARSEANRYMGMYEDQRYANRMLRKELEKRCPICGHEPGGLK